MDHRKKYIKNNNSQIIPSFVICPECVYSRMNKFYPLFRKNREYTLSTQVEQHGGAW